MSAQRGQNRAGPTDAGQGRERATEQLTLHYDENFLSYHAGRVITEPEVAVVELVANCWDAGADTVEITWPKEAQGQLAIADNGSGMTRAEFERRWLTLNYNRRHDQGDEVDFPPGVRKRRRTAFGRNGIGRHAMFCFSREYFVETKKAGQRTRGRVTRTGGDQPFTVHILEEGTTKEHGTILSCRTERIGGLSEEAVRELIGSRFVADPDFSISVNGRRVQLKDLDHLCERFTIQVEGLAPVVVRRYDCERVGRTSKQNGVAWWVNRRLVGEPSWEGFGDSLLDARTATAKRYTYVVEADGLSKQVKPDWTGFYASNEVNETRKTVYHFIMDDLRNLTKDLRRERKKALLEQNRTTIERLPVISQEQVASFVEDLQLQCPTIGERELTHAVQVFANMEKARSGYALLDKMASLAPDDIDGLNAILDEWSISDARKVLSELRYRLDLIKQLEKLLDQEHADELHELQPLFERGLWIFGPEFEAISFISNRTLATIVREALGGGTLTTPEKRPDFVIFPERSIGVYSREAYNARHEVSGLAHVIIVELKRGGSVISHAEKDQAVGYVRQLRRSGKVNRDTIIEAYVLGTSVDPEAEEPTQEGKSTITPRSYNVVLAGAHARTFNLMRRLQDVGGSVRDPELRDVLTRTGDLFDQD